MSVQNTSVQKEEQSAVVVQMVRTNAKFMQRMHRIEASEMPFEAWAQAAHLPDGPVHDGMKIMDADYDRYGFPGGNALVLRAILSREPRTLRQYIKELAQIRKAKVTVLPAAFLLNAPGV